MGHARAGPPAGRTPGCAARRPPDEHANLPLHVRTREPPRQDAARRQGRQPVRDDADRARRAARLHHHHRRLPRVPGGEPPARRPDGRRCARTSRSSSARPARRFGGADRPLLVSVRSGSAMSMPGMMDTILNLGLNEQTLQGLIRRDRQSRASPGTRTAASSSSSARSRWACRTRSSITPWPRSRRASARCRTSTCRRRRCASSPAAFLRDLPRAHRRAVPAGPVRATRAVDPGGVPLVDGQARRRLSPPVPDHQGHGQRHRGQRLHDGVRQHGRRLARPASASPAIRAPARTSSTASTSSTPRARTSSPASAPRSRSRRWPRRCRSCTGSSSRCATGSRRTTARCRTSSSRSSAATLYCLQTRNGKMNARAMVVTSVEMLGEGLITREQALTRINADAARAAAGSRSSTRRTPPQPLAQGLPASPGAASGADRVRRRHRRGARQDRRQGHPGARGDQARGHPRLLRRAGDPDQPRRQDLARGRRRARHGQALRLGLRGDRRSTSASAAPRSAAPCCARATWSPSTARPATSTPARSRPSRPSSSPSSRTLLSWADDVARLRGDGQRRHAARRRARAPLRRRWASACAAPSGCSTTPSACRSCRR